jgi:hypothetical protein
MNKNKLLKQLVKYASNGKMSQNEALIRSMAEAALSGKVRFKARPNADPEVNKKNYEALTKLRKDGYNVFLPGEEGTKQVAANKNNMEKKSSSPAPITPSDYEKAYRLGQQHSKDDAERIQRHLKAQDYIEDGADPKMINAKLRQANKHSRNKKNPDYEKANKKQPGSYNVGYLTNGKSLGKTIYADPYKFPNEKILSDAVNLGRKNILPLFYQLKANQPEKNEKVLDELDKYTDRMHDYEKLYKEHSPIFLPKHLQD